MISIKLPTIEKHYEILETLFNSMPYLFWKDTKGYYQGINMNHAKYFRFNSPKDAYS